MLNQYFVDGAGPGVRAGAWNAGEGNWRGEESLQRDGGAKPCPVSAGPAGTPRAWCPGRSLKQKRYSAVGRDKKEG